MNTGEFVFDPLDYDDKTGLLNERGLLKLLDQLYLDQPGGFSVLAVDLDRLKAVNDSLGHDAGDEYLFNAGTLLSTCVRTERQDVIAARIHGDEFVAVLPGVEDPETLEMIRQRIEQTMDSQEIPASVGGKPHVLGESIESLLSDSDKMMLAMKKERKQATFDALPRRKRVASLIGERLMRYAGVNPPRQ